MFVLKVLGIIAAAVGLYLFVEWFNNYTEQKGNYRFFSTEHTMAYGAGYLMCFIGYRSMETFWKEDLLSSMLVITIGVIILLFTIINNFRNTPASLAIKGSIAQVILYVPVIIAGAIILAMLVAFFAQTKPVFTINSRG